MTNGEIAKVLEEIGEMLELKNESSFRVNAYQAAARQIGLLSENLTDIYHQKGTEGLKAIKGIGESISEKIAELIEEGRLEYYQDLKKKIPQAELELTEIPGVGPKAAQKLYKLLKVKSVKDLKKKVADIISGEKVKEIEGFKEQSLKNVLRGIEILERQTGRMLLSEAYPIAEEVLSTLRLDKNILRVDVVGSLRRVKETVGDIDVVASMKSQILNTKSKINPKSKIQSSKINLKSKILNLKSKGVIDNFIHYPFVERVIAQGKTKATIIHNSGREVDLEILSADQYGSLLQHFTGSKEHNIALRTYAEQQGFSVSEHGIKRLRRKFPISNFQFPNKSQIPNSKMIKCRKEEEVYETLGMEIPPPELRENRGEIEASLRSAQGKLNGLPKLVKLSDIKGDLHLHTIDSDGQMTIEKVVAQARRLGYQYICISDHTKALGMVHGLDENGIKRQIETIKKLNQKMPGFHIFSGVEVNILANGKLDIDDKILSQVEIVTASIHSAFFQDRQKITERLLKVFDNPHVDIIGHPSGRILGRRESISLDWNKVFYKAAKTKTALEINSQPDRLDLRDTLCQEAKKYGVKFVINTDAHQPLHLENMFYGVAVARRGWLEKDDILNTLSLNKLSKWFNK